MSEIDYFIPIHNVSIPQQIFFSTFHLTQPYILTLSQNSLPLLAAWRSSHYVSSILLLGPSVLGFYIAIHQTVYESFHIKLIALAKNLLDSLMLLEVLPCRVKYVIFFDLLARRPRVGIDRRCVCCVILVLEKVSSFKCNKLNILLNSYSSYHLTLFLGTGSSSFISLFL